MINLPLKQQMSYDVSCDVTERKDFVYRQRDLNY